MEIREQPQLAITTDDLVNDRLRYALMRLWILWNAYEDQLCVWKCELYSAADLKEKQLKGAAYQISAIYTYMYLYSLEQCGESGPDLHLNIESKL